MQTLNYKLTKTGKHVASGPGNATITSFEQAGWAIGTSNSSAPTKATLHSLQFGKDLSMDLDTGEHLWAFGDGMVAVTAAVAGSGDV